MTTSKNIHCIHCEFREVSGGFVATATVSIDGEPRATIPQFVASSASTSEVNCAIEAAIASALRYSGLSAVSEETIPFQIAGSEANVSSDIPTATDEEPSQETSNKEADEEATDSSSKGKRSAKKRPAPIASVFESTGSKGNEEAGATMPTEELFAESPDKESSAVAVKEIPDENAPETSAEPDAIESVTDSESLVTEAEEGQVCSSKEMTLAQARKILFELKEGAKVAPSSWLDKFVGKPLGELADHRPSAIGMMVCNASLPSEKSLSAMRIIASSIKA